MSVFLLSLSGITGIAGYYFRIQHHRTRDNVNLIENSPPTSVLQIYEDLSNVRRITKNNYPHTFYAIAGQTHVPAPKAILTRLGEPQQQVLRSRVAEVQLVEEDEKVKKEIKDDHGVVVETRTSYRRRMKEIELTNREQGEVFSFTDNTILEPVKSLLGPETPYVNIEVPHQHISWSRMWQLHDQQVRDPANNSSINMTLTLGSIAGLFDAPQPSRVVASRVTEHVIPLNKPVYCMGEVMLDGKRLILRPSSSNEDDKPFIVRYGSQYEVAQEIKAEAESYKTWSNYMFGLSGVTGAGALALIANDVSRQTR